MFSTDIVKNVKQAGHYYLGRDNYYFEDSELAKERSSWWGKGAALLNLSGQVEPKQFEALLSGHLPDGQVLGIKADGEMKHRPGFDLTFSVPKSVSLVALMSKDESVRETIFQCLFNAAKKTLKVVESHCAQARITEEGETSYIPTHNLTAALFLHDLSREGDPQLHVHSIVMNMTQRPDGKWRSLASQPGRYDSTIQGHINGFFERVRHHKHYFGTIFNSELAFELKQNHFPIQADNKYGNFEIEGISESAINLYSTRSRQIKEYMNKFGFSGAKAAALVTLKTRQSKKNIDRETVHELWHMKGKHFNVDAFGEVEAVINKVMNHKVEAPKNVESREPQENMVSIDAYQSIQYAIDELSETQNKMTHLQIMGLAVKQTFDKSVSLSSITKALDEAIALKELVPVEMKEGDLLYTSKKLLQYEKDIISGLHEMVDGKLSVNAKKITDYFIAKNYNEDQKNAIRTIFEGNYRISGLDGISNTGKTMLIKPMVELAQCNGFEAIILTPTKNASLALKQHIREGPSSIRHFFKNLFDTNQYSTVTQFIAQQMKHIEAGTQWTHKRIMFVDHFQLLSTKQIRDLMFISNHIHARMVVIGDSRSILSFQTGNQFKQMIDHGLKTVFLSSVSPSKETFRHAVENLLSGDIQKAFEKIQHRVFSIENKEARLNAMAAHYTHLQDTERHQTLVVMPSQAQCDEMNVAIHEALKKEHKIPELGIRLQVLSPKFLKSTEYRLIQSYKVDQWVRFNDDYSSLNIQRGDYRKIIEINKNRNTIILVNEQGQQTLWNPLQVAGVSGKVELFDEQSREISVGECIVFKRNYAFKDIHKGEKFKVLSICNQKMVFERENHKIVKLNLKYLQARHFDYGYASTPYGIHDQKLNTVIAYQSAYLRQSHQRSFYKLLSQARSQAWVYTENKEQLLVHLEKHTGDSPGIIETLLQSSERSFNQIPSQQEHTALLEKAILNAISRFENLIKNKEDQVRTPEEIAKEAVQYALRHLVERQAAFEHSEVIVVALKYALGETNSDLIEKTILEVEQNGALVKGVFTEDGVFWTTKEAITMEREIIALAQSDRDTLTPIASEEIVEKHINETTPKKDHIQAVREWMRAIERVIIIQGYAGTGKTSLLQNTNLLFQQEGYELLCLAPTHAAVKELKSRHLNAQTLDSFLAEQRTIFTQKIDSIPKYGYRRIIVLDENSMTSNRRQHDFLSYTRDLEIRAVIMGDVKQFHAIESGKPHWLLQKAGVKTIFLTDIVRQQDRVLLKAVQETYQNDFGQAFDTLKNHIVEIGLEKIDEKIVDNPFIRYRRIGKDYTELPRSERSRTLVITQGNEDRVEINSVIRKELKEIGELKDEPVNFDILVQKDMTRVEQTNLNNYNPGEVIRFGFHEPKPIPPKMINSKHGLKNCRMICKQ